MADEQPRARLTKRKPSMETKNSKTENNILSEVDMLTTGWQDYLHISKFKMSVSSSDIFSLPDSIFVSGRDRNQTDLTQMENKTKDRLLR